MNSFDRRDSYNVSRQQARAVSNASFMSQVYFWMTAGLLMSGIVAYETAQTNVAMYIATSKVLWFGLILAQFAAVMVLSTLINRMSGFLASFTYMGYAFLTGVTFSVIFLTFTTESISQAFFITAFSFIGLSVFGYVTKRDLGPIGSFCMMGLFGLIGIMLLTLIFPSMLSNAMAMTINVCSIIIFAGLTAYDTQKIKSFNSYTTSAEDVKRAAIHGALALYLDFINLFLSILRLTGGRR